MTCRFRTRAWTGLARQSIWTTAVTQPSSAGPLPSPVQLAHRCTSSPRPPLRRRRAPRRERGSCCERTACGQDASTPGGCPRCPCCVSVCTSDGAAGTWDAREARGSSSRVLRLRGRVGFGAPGQAPSSRARAMWITFYLWADRPSLFLLRSHDHCCMCSMIPRLSYLGRVRHLQRAAPVTCTLLLVNHGRSQMYMLVVLGLLFSLSDSRAVSAVALVRVRCSVRSLLSAVRIIISNAMCLLCSSPHPFWVLPRQPASVPKTRGARS